MTAVFDPLEVLRRLDAAGVAYVVVGEFAAVIHGSPDFRPELEIVPQMREPNLERLRAALDPIAAQPIGALSPAAGQAAGSLRLETTHGAVVVTPEPAGTRGYDDLRRKATREPVARRLRPQVAAVADLIRVLHERGREEDEPRLHALRRIAELTRGEIGRSHSA